MSDKEFSAIDVIEMGPVAGVEEIEDPRVVKPRPLAHEEDIDIDDISAAEIVEELAGTDPEEVQAQGETDLTYGFNNLDSDSCSVQLTQEQVFEHFERKIFTPRINVANSRWEKFKFDFMLFFCYELIDELYKLEKQVGAGIILFIIKNTTLYRWTEQEKKSRRTFYIITFPIHACCEYIFRNFILKYCSYRDISNIVTEANLKNPERRNSVLSLIAQTMGAFENARNSVVRAVSDSMTEGKWLYKGMGILSNMLTGISRMLGGRQIAGGSKPDEHHLDDSAVVYSAGIAKEEAMSLYKSMKVSQVSFFIQHLYDNAGKYENSNRSFGREEKRLELERYFIFNIEYLDEIFSDDPLKFMFKFGLYELAETYFIEIWNNKLKDKYYTDKKDEYDKTSLDYLAEWGSKYYDENPPNENTKRGADYIRCLNIWQAIIKKYDRDALMSYIYKIKEDSFNRAPIAADILPSNEMEIRLTNYFGTGYIGMHMKAVLEEEEKNILESIGGSAAYYWALNGYSDQAGKYINYWFKVNGFKDSAWSRVLYYTALNKKVDMLSILQDEFGKESVTRCLVREAKTSNQATITAVKSGNITFLRYIISLFQASENEQYLLDAMDGILDPTCDGESGYSFLQMLSDKNVSINEQEKITETFLKRRYNLGIGLLQSILLKNHPYLTDEIAYFLFEGNISPNEVRNILLYTPLEEINILHIIANSQSYTGKNIEMRNDISGNIFLINLKNYIKKSNDFDIIITLLKKISNEYMDPLSTAIKNNCYESLNSFMTWFLDEYGRRLNQQQTETVIKILGRALDQSIKAGNWDYMYKILRRVDQVFVSLRGEDERFRLFSREICNLVGKAFLKISDYKRTNLLRKYLNLFEKHEIDMFSDINVLDIMRKNSVLKRFSEGYPEGVQILLNWNRQLLSGKSTNTVRKNLFNFLLSSDEKDGSTALSSLRIDVKSRELLVNALLECFERQEDPRITVINENTCKGLSDNNIDQVSFLINFIIKGADEGYYDATKSESLPEFNRTISYLLNKANEIECYVDSSSGIGNSLHMLMKYAIQFLRYNSNGLLDINKIKLLQNIGMYIRKMTNKKYLYQTVKGELGEGLNDGIGFTPLDILVDAVSVKNKTELVIKNDIKTIIKHIFPDYLSKYSLFLQLLYKEKESLFNSSNWGLKEALRDILEEIVYNAIIDKDEATIATISKNISQRDKISLLTKTTNSGVTYAECMLQSGLYKGLHYLLNGLDDEQKGIVYSNGTEPLLFHVLVFADINEVEKRGIMSARECIAVKQLRAKHERTMRWYDKIISGCVSAVGFAERMLIGMTPEDERMCFDETDNVEIIKDGWKSAKKEAENRFADIEGVCKEINHLSHEFYDLYKGSMCKGDFILE